MPSLLAVAAAHDVVGVFTQADRPAGRGLKLRATAVKAAAVGASLPVETPDKLDARFVGSVARLRPETLVTVSYGKILPAALLAVPTLGALNLHPSLLPAYRGATPIQSALRDGLTETGVSVIWMTPKMDAGDIALERRVAIEPADDFGTLHDRLAGFAAELIALALARLSRGALGRVPQDEAVATFTRPLTRQDGRLSFEDAGSSANLVRSLSPAPGAWTELAGKRIKVLRARAEPAVATRPQEVGTTLSGGAAAPGVIASLEGDGPVIACRTGALRLLRVVPEGKPPMSGADFVRYLKSLSA